MITNILFVQRTLTNNHMARDRLKLSSMNIRHNTSDPPMIHTHEPSLVDLAHIFKTHGWTIVSSHCSVQTTNSSIVWFLSFVALSFLSYPLPLLAICVLTPLTSYWFTYFFLSSHSPPPLPLIPIHPLCPKIPTPHLTLNVHITLISSPSPSVSPSVP